MCVFTIESLKETRIFNESSIKILESKRFYNYQYYILLGIHFYKLILHITSD